MSAMQTSFEAFRSIVEGRRIMITGGSGTVGYELVKALLPLRPKVLRIYSRDEQKQFYMREEFRSLSNVRFLIGDVRDYPRLKRAMENIQIVFHLAALKHVESCEYNPFEAIKTNINGTQNVIDAALGACAEKVVFTSTDKAVNPSNAMGASKLMAERLMTAAEVSKGARSTVFCSVRFGNVLGSSGSVIPTFVHRINSGYPVDITDENMTRFVISFKESLELIMTACRDAKGGELFVRKMPVVRIGDLATALIEMLGEEKGVKAPPINIIGPRAGEKLYEEIVTAEESARTVDIGRYLVVLPQIGRRECPFENARPIYPGAYTSQSDSPLSVAQIKDLLKSEDILTNPNLLSGMRNWKPVDPRDINGGIMETLNEG